MCSGPGLSAYLRCLGQFLRLLHGLAQIGHEGRTLVGALHQDAAPVRGVHLAAGQVQLTQAVERSGDSRLGDVQFLRQAPHRVRLVAEVDTQQHAQLPGREVRTIGPDHHEDGLLQNPDQPVGVVRFAQSTVPFQLAPRASMVGYGEG